MSDDPDGLTRSAGSPSRAGATVGSSSTGRVGRPCTRGGLGRVIFRLDFNGRHRVQWQQGRLTELYLLDEPTGLAAGHRPRGECRPRRHPRCW